MNGVLLLGANRSHEKISICMNIIYHLKLIFLRSEKVSHSLGLRL
jgi:hypothetical protein